MLLRMMRIGISLKSLKLSKILNPTIQLKNRRDLLRIMGKLSRA